jgi:hypothetical protein
MAPISAPTDIETSESSIRQKDDAGTRHFNPSPNLRVIFAVSVLTAASLLSLLNSYSGNAAKVCWCAGRGVRFRVEHQVFHTPHSRPDGGYDDYVVLSARARI